MHLKDRPVAYVERIDAADWRAWTDYRGKAIVLRDGVTDLLALAVWLRDRGYIPIVDCVRLS